MPIAIDFEMSVDANGYSLERGWIIGRGGAKRRMRLKDFPTLFLIFAKVQTPEGLLDFVTKFGRLANDELKAPIKRGQKLTEDDVSRGDDVRTMLGNTRAMSVALETIGAHMGNLPTWQGGRVEYEVPSLGKGAKVVGGIPLPGALTASLAPDPATGAWQLQLQPPCLLDAIWLQFGQALTSNAVLRSCGNCGKWFEAGVGSGRRADAKYCSDQCRVEHKSLERTRKKKRG
jgi:hypothetical protein